MDHTVESVYRYSPTVAIDFDGVIAEYSEWKGIGKFGLPIKGVQAALERLMKEGYTIIIHTTRGEVKQVAEYMLKHALPYTHINYNPAQAPHMNQGKPIADVYIDDRAITFNGQWTGEFVDKVIAHKPWYKRPEGVSEELLDTFIDLSNYALMAWCVAKSLGPEAFIKGQEKGYKVFLDKNQKYGNAFFTTGLSNAYNDIRRKWIRLEQLLKDED